MDVQRSGSDVCVNNGTNLNGDIDKHENLYDSSRQLEDQSNCTDLKSNAGHVDENSSGGDLNYNQSNNIHINSERVRRVQDCHNGTLNQKSSTVYDFNDSTSNCDESPSEMPLVMDNRHSVTNEKELDQSRSKALDSNHSLPISQSTQISPHMTSHNQNYIQSHSLSHSNQSIDQSSQIQRLNSQIGNQGMHHSSQAFHNSYNDSVSMLNDYSNAGGNYYDGIMRRGRGRPRGSKNGTGLGRTKGRGSKFLSLTDEDGNFDSRSLSDPYSCHKRGRPRSRFIVDLGEHNHEAWTKSKEKLRISDAELTTLLLSLFEARSEGKDSEDNGVVLSLASSEFKKWKEKFTSQLSLFTHYASIHNTTCCTCLGIKKKKCIPVGNGKRGRPRKYPPPIGYGTGIQRPDTVDEDGNIFEPQIILKDGTVKNEPNDDKQVPLVANSSINSGDSSDAQPPRTDSNISAASDSSDPFGMLNRPLTQEEMDKRKEYYESLKTKPKYVCNFCQIQFYSKHNYEYHISKLESNGKCKSMEKVNNLYLCDGCGEGFLIREKLEKHLRLSELHGTHNQKELQLFGEFQCSMCSKSFNKRPNFLQHVKWHEEREDIPCVICGTMFKQTELRHHLMEIHSNDSIPCSYCGKLFTSRKYLEKHEMIHQGGNFPCPDCGKVFSSKSTMQVHHRGHAFEKEYPCETCGQMLNQRVGLCLHLKKHFTPAEFSFECDICARFFASEYLLRYHKKKIHNIPVDGVTEDLSDQADYMSSPMSSQLSGEDDREKTGYSLSGNVVKNMISNLPMGTSLESTVNLTMKNEGETLEEGQLPLRNSLNMNEHLRHMGDQRDNSHLKDPMDQDDSMRIGGDHHALQQVRDDHIHMPQDLTRMASNPTQMSESADRMSSAANQVNDIRSSSTDSTGRMSDASMHMMDNLGRMAVENFGRMASTTGGYLAEHLRRMAENQSRMTETMSHYDDRDNYSRLGDNLRNMSRGGADPMGRLGDNLSHMGVIRPSQGSSGSSQWPPHMQNHSALEGMNQSAQATGQHALYPLPFWPYDPSLRQYHH